MIFVASSLQLFSLLFYATGSNALRCSYLKLNNYSFEANFHIVNYLAQPSGSELQPATPIETVTTEECAQPNSFCFALWQYNVDDPFEASQYRLKGKGCSNSTQDTFCDSSQCLVSLKPSQALNDTKFCCCRGNLCNLNFSIVATDEYSDEKLNIDFEPEQFYEEIERNTRLFIWIFFFIALFCAVMIGFAIYCKSTYSNRNISYKDNIMDSLHLLESQSIEQPQLPSFQTSTTYTGNLEDLKFVEIIGKGKYGAVWKGKLGNLSVAIKTVSLERQYMLANECRIYSLPHMSHASLPHFYGCQERLMENGIGVQCCMAIEYGELGSLNKYLRENTFDWKLLCNLIRTLVQGVSYLHTEILKDKKLKPSIAHNDLCSSNIVVRSDFSCMICDFQLSKCFRNDAAIIPVSSAVVVDEQDASVMENARYLAPEILQGAINLGNCESTFKQADIYSLGLILWEVVSRCSDLYQGIEVPAYKMPFEQELGLEPSFDQIKVLITRHKARPLFPDIWKDSNPAIRLLKETIVECWDQEPEARLTAFCVEERVRELPHLWQRYRMETLSNCCVVVSSLQKQLKSIQNNLNTNSGDTDGVICGHKASLSNESKYAQSNCCINKFENSLHYKYNNYHHLLHHPYHNHHFYQLTLGNAIKKQDNVGLEKNVYAAANMNGRAIVQPKLTLPLQPHQARNPCIERNLMLETSDEHDGLLEQGLKFQTKPLIKSRRSDADGNVEHIDAHQRANDAVSSSELSNEPNSNYSASRIPLLRTPLPLPISYVQNPVRRIPGSGDQVIKAKDTNKFQNRHDSSKLSSKMGLFEYIKEKLNFATQLKKRNGLKSRKRPLTEKGNIPDENGDDYTDNCDTNVINIERTELLLAAKGGASIDDCSEQNASLVRSHLSAANANNSDSGNGADGGNGSSSTSRSLSSLISAEFDSPYDVEARHRFTKDGAIKLVHDNSSSSTDTSIRGDSSARNQSNALTEVNRTDDRDLNKFNNILHDKIEPVSEDIRLIMSDVPWRIPVAHAP